MKRSITSGFGERPSELGENLDRHRYCDALAVYENPIAVKDHKVDRSSHRRPYPARDSVKAHLAPYTAGHPRASRYPRG